MWPFVFNRPIDLTIFYTSNGREERFQVKLKTKFSYADLQQFIIGTEGSPFFGVDKQDIMFLYGSPYTNLSGNIIIPSSNLDKVFKSKSMWVVTKENVSFTFMDENGNEELLSIKLWEKDFSVTFCRGKLSRLRNCSPNDVEIFATFPGISYAIRLHDRTYSTTLIYHKMHLSVKFTKDSQSKYPRLTKNEIDNAITNRFIDLSLYTLFEDIFAHTSDGLCLTKILFGIIYAFEPLTIDDLSPLLDLSPEVVSAAMNELNPVIELSSQHQITFVHKYVLEYVDSLRFKNHELSFNLNSFKVYLSTDICKNSIRILNTCLTYNIAKLPPQTLHKDIPDFDTLVSNAVPNHLRYAALNFWKHYELADHRERFSEELRTFVLNKLLNWIELLSLLKCGHLIHEATTTICKYYQQMDDRDFTKDLLSDASIMYEKFRFAIVNSSLQVYSTAIPFSPKKTMISINFLDKLPTNLVPKVVEGPHSKWSKEVSHFGGCDSAVLSVQASGDGRYVVGGCRNGSICVWFRDSGNLVRKLKVHRTAVNTIAISKKSELLASGSSDCTIMLWVLESGEYIRTLSGHLGEVHSIFFSLDGKDLVSGGFDKTVRIWSLSTGVNYKTFRSDGLVHSVTISKSGLIFSGSANNTVTLWNRLIERAERTYSGLTNSVKCVVITSDEKFVIGGGKQSEIIIWKVSGEQEVRLTKQKRTVTSLCVSGDDKLIVAGFSDNNVRIWSIEEKKLVKSFQGHGDIVNSVSLTTGSQFLVSGSSDNSVKLWTTDSESKMNVVKEHASKVKSVVISSDGNFIVSKDESETTAVWKVSTGHIVRTILPETLDMEQNKSHHDGSRIFRNFDFENWNGWVMKDGKVLCWLPREYRVGVKHAFFKCGILSEVQRLEFCSNGLHMDSGSKLKMGKQKYEANMKWSLPKMLKVGFWRLKDSNEEYDSGINSPKYMDRRRWKLFCGIAQEQLDH